MQELGSGHHRNKGSCSERVHSSEGFCRLFFSPVFRTVPVTLRVLCLMPQVFDRNSSNRVNQLVCEAWSAVLEAIWPTGQAEAWQCSCRSHEILGQTEALQLNSRIEVLQRKPCDPVVRLRLGVLKPCDKLVRQVSRYNC